MTVDYILTRYSDNREDTLGLLHRITAQKPFFIGYTLEDQFQGVKVKKETRIPAGRYEIVINRAETPKTLTYRKRYSWFYFHLMLKDVTGFVGIYIHVGNTDGDTEGCILVGDQANNNRQMQGQVMNSTECFRRLYGEVYEVLDKKENGKYVNQAFITVRDENFLKL